MEKVKIKLVTIGHLPLHLNLKQVSMWNSEVFELIGGVDNFDLRCDSDGPGWEFSDKLLKDQLSAHTGARLPREVAMRASKAGVLCPSWSKIGHTARPVEDSVFAPKAPRG